eukprot:gene14841-15027_t
MVPAAAPQDGQETAVRSKIPATAKPAADRAPALGAAAPATQDSQGEIARCKTFASTRPVVRAPAAMVPAAAPWVGLETAVRFK